MTLPRYFTREESTTAKSQRQERTLASKFKGKTQIGSGSRRFNKGDVKTVELLIEAKQTTKESISIKRDWIEKIWKEAVGYNKTPALAFEFIDWSTRASRGVEKHWIAVPASFLQKLIDHYMDEKTE